jgi:rare lipoprotein A
MANRPPASLRVAIALGAGLLVAATSGCVSRSDLAPDPRSSPGTFEGAHDAPPARGEVQVGLATWYGGALAGHPTANGERFDPSQMTAAHRHLEFGTWVEVTRLDTGQSVRVRINDRGPFGNEDRIIDLSRGAAEKIGLVRTGVTKVQVRIVDGP